MSWSLEEVKEAENTLLRVEMALTGMVTHEEVVECVRNLAELVTKLIADERHKSEHDAFTEELDENGD